MTGRVPAWGGNRARQLVRACLTLKGTTCHLCGLGGADSADHNPPRSQLIQAGVRDPDAMRFLFPAHYAPCNRDRRDRPITDELRAELRNRLLTMHRVKPGRSARFARLGAR